MDTPKVSKNSVKLAEAEKQIADYKDKLARSLADYANLEKRIADQRQLIATLTVAAIVNQLLAVLDDFYLASTHLKDAGLQMTIDKFVSVLKAQGVEEITALGQKFDPNSMDCVGVKEGESGQVLEIHKKGYKLNGSVIRPSQVVVGKMSN